MKGAKGRSIKCKKLGLIMEIAFTQKLTCFHRLCSLFEDTTEITTVKENAALTVAIESTLFDHE